MVDKFVKIIKNCCKNNNINSSDKNIFYRRISSIKNKINIYNIINSKILIKSLS